MKESLELFEQVINNRWFEKTSIVLFLNKKDLLEKTLASAHLSKCFHDYAGDNSYNSAVKFIKDKFVKINKKEDRKIYTHKTCATDTEGVRVVWNAVREILLSGSMNEIVGF